MDDVFAGESQDMPGMSASEAFVQQLTAQVNRKDIRAMVAAQVHMLQRFEKTNEMLLNFNALSKGRYETTQQEFRKHTILLASMKKDLDSVFKRIRTIKGKLSKQYPDAFKACSDVYNLMEEEEEDEDEISVTSGAQTPVTPKILMCPAQSEDFPTPVHANTDSSCGEGVKNSVTSQSGEAISPNYDRTSTSTIVEEGEDLQSPGEGSDIGKS